jgi:hypothetical protein
MYLEVVKAWGLAAMKANVDYLVTLNRRHFLDDPDVRERTGLRIGVPGDKNIKRSAHNSIFLLKA